MGQMRRKRVIELDEAAVDAPGDEESEREAWLLRVELAILKAVDQISILKQVWEDIQLRHPTWMGPVATLKRHSNCNGPSSQGHAHVQH